MATKKTTKKVNLKEKLADIKHNLKSLCVDQAQANTLIKELLSVQQQMDIGPMELGVPMKEVQTVYNFGVFSLVKCKTCIIFKTTGFRVVAKPLYQQSELGGALYSQLSSLCEMKEEFDKGEIKEKDMQDLYNAVFNATITILSIPLDIFADQDYFFDVATFVTKRKIELYQKFLDAPLKEETDEDLKKNAEFEAQIKLAEELKESAPKDEQ